MPHVGRFLHTFTVARKAKIAWGIFCTVFIGLGATMLTTSPPEYKWAAIFFGLAGMCALGWWLSSDFLANTKPRVSLVELPSIGYSYLWWKWGGCFIILVITIFVIGGVEEKKRHWEREKLEGWLIPGDEASPIVNCTSFDPRTNAVLPPSPVNIPNDALALYLANSVIWTTHFPLTILAVGDNPRVILNRDKHGKIAITLHIFDSGHPPKLIARVDDNYFFINQLNYLSRIRTDHKLSVTDQEEKEVLSLEYLNKRAVRMSALLHYPEFGEEILTLNNKEIAFGRFRYSSNCIGEVTRQPVIRIYPENSKTGAVIINRADPK